MNDYTPTTRDIRYTFCNGVAGHTIGVREVVGDAFDRWLDQTLAAERERISRSLPTQDELEDIIGEAFFDAWQEQSGRGAEMAAAAVLKRIT